MTAIAREDLATTTRSDGSGRVTAPALGSLRVLRNEVVEELLAILREPAALFFSVAMPVGFFAMMVHLWGAEASFGGAPAATTMLATFGAFGVVGIALMGPGIGIADDRERGWLRAKQVSATPVGISLAAKVIAAIPYAVAILVAMTGLAATTGHLEIGAGAWVRLLGALLLGTLPFALLGMTVGALASPNATTAILQAIHLPSAVASGLWFPLEMLPEVVQRIAPALPTYHLAHLALAQLGEGTGAVHALALVGFAAVAAVGAALAYRAASR